MAGIYRKQQNNPEKTGSLINCNLVFYYIKSIHVDEFYYMSVVSWK